MWINKLIARAHKMLTTKINQTRIFAGTVWLSRNLIVKTVKSYQTDYGNPFNSQAKSIKTSNHLCFSFLLDTLGKG
jgi:hypothetical protein